MMGHGIDMDGHLDHVMKPLGKYLKRIVLTYNSVYFKILKS